MTTTSTPPTTTAPAAEPPAGPPDAPFPARFLNRLPARFRVPAAFLLGAVLLVGVAPLVLSDFRLGLLAKYLCYGIVAVGVSLAWGRGGLLVLGQGVFFGLGGYAMAMHLKLADAAATGQPLPDFMQLYGTEGGLPWWWQPFANPVFALAMTVLLPMAVAALLGVLVFRRRVKGAYFAILSQALAAALAIWLVGQQATTGGTNGLTDFQGFFGYDLNDPVNQRMVYIVIAIALLLLMALARQLFVSRYGELLVAVRDSEERVRFLGYNPANVKLVAYVAAAGMAGLAGALFVPAVGIISPALIGVVPSIGFVIGAAVGGRASLVGAVLGAIAVAWAQSTVSDAWPAGWTYLQGLLFVVAVGFLPGGLASLRTVLRGRRTPDPGAATTTKGAAA
ncbi:urea ABC transporter permease subunit UrtC [Streptomyces griseus]|uniref:Urea ABC transporter permease subunit UrtC n=1 Tax=Streptomyces stephensoniae TaxID=3375367 RepID=A0ABU2VYZ2_9ACTN|nr:urea ABC transporter permease subunit UrtC [Streptomyces griseus]MDT0490299.1 urea ABC transporter permease subunit UrtC [Streptomyces griseus]